jgi:hypothetical protein
MRVHLSAAEAGCVLQVATVDGDALARVALAGAAVSHLVEVKARTAQGPLASGLLWFVVLDAVGNRSQRQIVVNVRARDLRLDVVAVPPAAAFVGGELVFAESGGQASIAVNPIYRVARADLQLSAAAPADGGPRVTSEGVRDGFTVLRFAATPPGAHVLRLDLEESEGSAGPRVSHDLPVRVLPARLEVRVPVAKSRFLPAVQKAGLLARRVQGYGEGPGWRIDPTWSAYLRGTLWVGGETLVPVSLPEREGATDPLLPQVVLVSGRNLLAVELRDVLERRVRVVAGDAPAPRLERSGISYFMTLTNQCLRQQKTPSKIGVLSFANGLCRWFIVILTTIQFIAPIPQKILTT